MNQTEALAILTKRSEAQQAPNSITFASYDAAGMKLPSGEDHLIWAVSVGKNHTATIIMDQDTLAALEQMERIAT